MADPTELKMAFRASGNMELRTTLSQLVQDLTDTYILVERGPGQWGVLRAAELAWLPGCKTLDELEKYFLPSYVLIADGMYHRDIVHKILEQPTKIALISRGGRIEQIVAAPPDLGDAPSGRGVMVVICASCTKTVVTEPGSTLCPVCSKSLLR